MLKRANIPLLYIGYLKGDLSMENWYNKQWLTDDKIVLFFTKCWEIGGLLK